MDRYKIAVGKRIQAYRFPATQSITRTVKYADYCVKNKAVLVADNIPVFILESALIRISQTTGVPIIVKSLNKAQILSTVHSYKNIHSIEEFKENSERRPILNNYYFPYLIYYDCPILQNVKTYLKVSTRSS